MLGQKSSEQIATIAGGFINLAWPQWEVGTHTALRTTIGMNKICCYFCLCPTWSRALSLIIFFCEVYLCDGILWMKRNIIPLRGIIVNITRQEVGPLIHRPLIYIHWWHPACRGDHVSVAHRLRWGPHSIHDESMRTVYQTALPSRQMESSTWGALHAIHRNTSRTSMASRDWGDKEVDENVADSVKIQTRSKIKERDIWI